MARIDLHVHSTASDGELSPVDLVAAAAAQGVTALAITDHDTTAGVTAAVEAGRRLGVEVVPGVELNTDLEPPADGGPDHADILGYFVDIDHPPFARLLEDIQAARDNRARMMVERLQRLGARIDFEDVAALATGAIGRPHVARALAASSFVPDVASAFHDYLGRGRPAYVARYRLTCTDACTVVRAAGGVPVLAHPVPPLDPWRDPLRLRTFLPPLVEAGLGGLECHYPRYTARVVRWLSLLARHFGLVPTGGTDYHGPYRDDRQLGSVDLPPDTVDRLRAAVR